MTDYSKKIFKVLGIEPDEEFKIYDTFTNKCFTEIFKYDSTFRLYSKYSDDGEWLESYPIYLERIISGKYEIKKNKIPTDDDIVALKYGKLCGYNWVAKDKSGRTYFYSQKPEKNHDYWENYEAFWYCPCGISFLSWEDEKPIMIDEILM